MGLSGVSMSELLIVLLIVALLFGTRRLGTIGSDLGAAIRGFRRSMSGDDDAKPDPDSKPR
jgi:sec-independent protein translocase protein TatA